MIFQSLQRIIEAHPQMIECMKHTRRSLDWNYWLRQTAKQRLPLRPVQLDCFARFQDILQILFCIARNPIDQSR